MNELATAAITGAVSAFAINAAPAALFWPALRRRTWPTLAGFGDPQHVALTFDDGPNPESTPLFLSELDKYGVKATFFLLGGELIRNPELGREIASAGHEIALHGWHHRRLIWSGPRRTYEQLARGRDLITSVIGTPPRWFRPPYGVLTTTALSVANSLDLKTVLWTCWGWDWSAQATPESVLDTTTRGLTGGGTILLHDSDVAAAAGSWKSTLGALPHILETCAQRGLSVGPLRDHGLEGTPNLIGLSTNNQSSRKVHY